MKTILRIIITAVLVLACSGAAEAITKRVTWRNYTVDGRSVSVHSLLQSPEGPVWIGSNSGIYIFDGYRTIPVYYEDGTRFQYQVYSMIRDTTPSGSPRIWLGTNNGVFVYDYTDGKVHSIENTNFPHEIRAMLLSENTLWIGSLSGLYTYDTASGTLSGPVADIPHKAVYALLQSSVDGALYIGTYNGLCRYSAWNGRYTTVNIPSGKGSPSNFFVNSLADTPDGRSLMIGTEGELLRYTPEGGSVEIYPRYSGNSVKAIAFRNANSMVIGTDNGLFLGTPDASAEPEVYRHDARDPRSIADNSIWSLMFDNKGNLWTGTEIGISIADMDSPVKVIPLSDLTGRSDGQQIYSILRDRSGHLWLGGTNGLICLSGIDGREMEWFMPSDNRFNLSHNRVRDIFESANGDVWVSTDGGLNRFDPARHRFDNYRVVDNRHHRNANWAYGTVEDPENSTLWVGGFLGGLFGVKEDRLPAGGGTVEAVTTITAGDGLRNELINKIARDSNGNKWVLLFRDSCITRIDARSGKITKVNIMDKGTGWPSTVVADSAGYVWCGFPGGICKIDSDGRIVLVRRIPAGSDDSAMSMGIVGREIWLATNKGVWAFDRDSGESHIVPLPDKVYTSVYYDDTSGNVLLGSIDEVVMADPKKLHPGRTAEKVCISQLLSSGHGIKPSADSTTVELPFSSNNLTVELSTYDFTPYRYSRFAYRIAGRDTVWTILDDNKNTIALSDLTEGSHKLEMQIAGDPSTRSTLTVEVLPPWYRTLWAKFLWTFLFLGLATATVFYFYRRNMRKLEEIERRNALSKVEERLTFLSNISHDLKTPLSMIIGPLSNIRDKISDEEVRRSVETAYKNALRLNTLIHRSIEADRLDASTEPLVIYSRVDVVEFTRSIFNSYREAYPRIHFDFTSDTEHLPSDIDAVKFESVINNLLSNAVKYSGEEAEISISIVGSDDNGNFSLTISDNGIGIPDREQSLVFHRLFRSSSTSGISEGTGIGLYLVKQYVEMHGGKIELQSRQGEGSSFRITMPLKQLEAPDGPAGQTENVTDPSDTRRRILIVDDNKPIAEFIRSLFDSEYRCLTAPNGKDGLELAASFRPDIIIADEMMPLMSGLEMSRKLKSTPALSSIPVILLTAKTDNDLESESVRAGIDMFMTKPFDAKLLKARVKRMLDSSDAIRRAVRIEEITDAKPIQAESAHEKQLAQVTAVIEENISDPDLNVAFVCEKTGIQQKQLYRLIKKYVGSSPVDYIRQTRLRKAAMLLEQGHFNVSEIMYMVGFSSPSYFSKCFSAMYGCNPSQYKGELPPKEA